MIRYRKQVDFEAEIDTLYQELRLLDGARPYCVRVAEVMATDLLVTERELAALAADTSWLAVFKNRRKMLYKTAMRDVIRRLLLLMETTVGDRDRLVEKIAKAETILARTREDNPQLGPQGANNG